MQDHARVVEKNVYGYRFKESDVNKENNKNIDNLKMNLNKEYN